MISAKWRAVLCLSFFTAQSGPILWRAVKIGFGIRVLENMAWSLAGSAILGVPWMETFYSVPGRQVVSSVAVAPVLETLWLAAALMVMRALRCPDVPAATAVGVCAMFMHPDAAPIMLPIWGMAFFIYARAWQAERQTSTVRASILVAAAHSFDNLTWVLINTAHVGIYGEGWTVLPHRCCIYLARLIIGGA